jgi:hypothetical protein
MSSEEQDKADEDVVMEALADERGMFDCCRVLRG